MATAAVAAAGVEVQAAAAELGTVGAMAADMAAAMVPTCRQAAGCAAAAAAAAGSLRCRRLALFSRALAPTIATPPTPTPHPNRSPSPKPAPNPNPTLTQPRQDLALFSTHLTAEEMAPRAMVRS